MLVRGIWRVNKLSYDDDEDDRLSDMCVESKEEESKFDEEDYSDSFEDANNTIETVKHEDIEELLKTATEETLNILK